MNGHYEHFFDLMEDMGFFDHIYEKLPEDFTAVFEIARVFEDENHPFTQMLQPALTMIKSREGKKRGTVVEEELQIFSDDIEEYEATHIKSPQDLPRMYNSQWLLPDEVLYRKLANKELWVPYVRKPKYLPVELDPKGYHPDSGKQNVYILVDTSSSMALKNRINIAKAATYHFLKQNMQELGYISLRTFDESIGELHTAQDTASFKALIQYIVRLHSLGNGTAMAAAIEQAVQDIRSTPSLAKTEILIITDGACALDEDKMRELLGDEIIIHTVKIGRSQLYVSPSYIKDKLFVEDTDQHRTIERLQQSLEELRREYSRTESPAHKQSLHYNIAHTEQTLNRQIDAMTEEIVVGYGHELERLAEVFVAIQDIDINDIISVTTETVDELRDLMRQLLNEMEEHPSVTVLRKLALLSDHVALLMNGTEDMDIKALFADIQKQMIDTLDSRLHSSFNPENARIMAHLRHQERMDLKFLLAGGNVAGVSIQQIIFAKIRMFVKRLFGRFG